ncbi:carbon-monoxide dehydrogenase medium subunit [Angulomicrobium tetraedrale]|uniref:Carbon-monoxide dehydrogenase medium subunit n=1 Tax=Ancylobacter tetraedralis TaxID=217068 RepID=A0A839Z755_9HYPH|nr:xanthine dehydrogenase family protein subunit M [Ancylobacter tetraedralis]MBB3770246.1 carbon-monoxide dehydrogenase medium subunit [Ancylobacter tetraedralis]
MFPFTYHRPVELASAHALLVANEDAKLLAGGQTLIATLKQRLASPSDLVDLARVPGLTGMAREGEALTIGAMTRHAQVSASPLVVEALPALAELAGRIGDPAVRNRGTLGGSIANNDPSADYPAACLGLGAAIVTDRRVMAAGDFFLGLFETALEPDEIIVSVRFPIGGWAAYAKFANPASRYAMAGAFVWKGEGGVRVAITGAGQNGVFRWGAAEEALAADFRPAALEGLALDGDDMIADIHGSGTYRAHLAGVMTRRAVARILERGSP